jgi:alkyl sulfatase BDS1-like metallo-beta-lactamase superfamily hydrolase
VVKQAELLIMVRRSNVQVLAPERYMQKGCAEKVLAAANARE